jgi:hypothetical protein
MSHSSCAKSKHNALGAARIGGHGDVGCIAMLVGNDWVMIGLVMGI